MTTKARVEQRNPAEERDSLRADMAAARVAHDTTMGRQIQGRAQIRDLEEERRKLDMRVVLGVAGADEELVDVSERLSALKAADEQYQRGLAAADAIIKTREGQLNQLFTDPECWPFFVREAEAATAGALRDLQAIAPVVAQAAGSWAKAVAMWRPLNAALRERLEALNTTEGWYPEPASQAVVAPFPVRLPADLADMAPRPRGITRLREAGSLE